MFVYKHVFTMDKHIKKPIFIENFHRRLRMCQGIRKVPGYKKRERLDPEGFILGRQTQKQIIIQC